MKIETNGKKLRPGEKKILDVLTNGSRSFSKLKSETGLAPRHLSSYVKSLQKQSLIERDLDTREYKILEKSLDTLFLGDIIAVLQDALARHIKDKGRDTLDLDLWSKESLVFSTKPDFEKIINVSQEDDLKDSIFEKWEDYILGTRFRDSPEEQAIIRKYKQYMLIVARKLNHSEADEKQLRDSCEFMAKMKYATKYPNVKIPKEIIETEAEEEYKKVLKAENMILQPYSIDDLENMMEILSQVKLKRDSTYTEKELKEMEPILDYLDDPKNRNLYKKFKDRFDEMPKTLMVSPLLGFSGYLEQLRRINPEKAKAVEKQMREQQERALKQLVASSKTK